MSVENLLKLLLDPANAATLLTGLGAVFLAGFKAGTLLSNSEISVLKETNNRSRDEVTRALNERNEWKDKCDNQNAYYEKENSRKDAEIKALRSQIKTIRCAICGSSVKRIGERDEHSQYRSVPYRQIQLQCTGPECGQMTEINRDMLENLMQNLSNQT